MSLYSIGVRNLQWPFKVTHSSETTRFDTERKKVKQMIYIAVLCNPKITAEPLYNTPLFTGPYAAANNTALLAWRPSQGTKLYCLVNRGTLGVNNLPRVVARIVPRSESNPRPLDHESSALTTTPPSHQSRHHITHSSLVGSVTAQLNTDIEKPQRYLPVAVTYSREALSFSRWATWGLIWWSTSPTNSAFWSPHYIIITQGESKIL